MTFAFRSEGSRSLVAILLLGLLLPRSEDFLDRFGPFNLSAALVAVLGLEKNLTLAIVAEESLLLLNILRRGHPNTRAVK